jgi:hypothetical protein
MQLIVSDDERTAGALTPASLRTVLRDLNDRGVATLENAVPLEAIERVHSTYIDSCARGKPIKNPLLGMPFVDHRLIVRIMRAAMGDKIAWGLYYIHAVPSPIPNTVSLAAAESRLPGCKRTERWPKRLI